MKYLLDHGCLTTVRVRATLLLFYVQKLTKGIQQSSRKFFNSEVIQNALILSNARLKFVNFFLNYIISYYLQGSKHKHLLFCAVYFFVKQLPFSLFKDLVNPHGVIFGIKIIEHIELESQTKRIELTYTLFHYRQRGI